MEHPPEPAMPGEPQLEATRLPALARYWWLTAVRGLVALTLALAVVAAGRGTARLVTFLGLYWIDPDVLWPVAAAWGVASGTLLTAEGLRLRRFGARRSSRRAPVSGGFPAGGRRSRRAATT